MLCLPDFPSFKNLESLVPRPRHRSQAFRTCLPDFPSFRNLESLMLCLPDFPSFKNLESLVPKSRATPPPPKPGFPNVPARLSKFQKLGKSRAKVSCQSLVPWKVSHTYARPIQNLSLPSPTQQTRKNERKHYKKRNKRRAGGHDKQRARLRSYAERIVVPHPGQYRPAHHRKKRSSHHCLLRYFQGEGLERKGWAVLRFTEDDLNHNLEKSTALIYDTIDHYGGYEVLNEPEQSCWFKPPNLILSHKIGMIAPAGKPSDYCCQSQYQSPFCQHNPHSTNIAQPSTDFKQSSTDIKPFSTDFKHPSTNTKQSSTDFKHLSTNIKQSSTDTKHGSTANRIKFNDYSSHFKAICQHVDFAKACNYFVNF